MLTNLTLATEPGVNQIYKEYENLLTFAATSLCSSQVSGSHSAECDHFNEHDCSLNNNNISAHRETWKGDLDAPRNGMVVLGSPLGTEEFIAAHGEARMKEESLFLKALPRLSDLQCAWVLLWLCAVPRANHWIRTTPPQADGPGSSTYPALHDRALWRTLLELFGV